MLVEGYDEILPARDWTDIVQVAAGRLHVAGLKSDGTVVAVGRPLNDDGFVGETDVEDWTDIVYVAAGNRTTVGLKSDGTVIATGSSAKPEETDKWENVVAVKEGANSIVGLRSDGKILGYYAAEEWDLIDE